MVTDFSALSQSFATTAVVCLGHRERHSHFLPLNLKETDGVPHCVRWRSTLWYVLTLPNPTWQTAGFSNDSYFLSLSCSLTLSSASSFFFHFSPSLYREKIQTEKVPKYQLFSAKLSYVCSPSYSFSAPPSLTTTLLTELLGKPNVYKFNRHKFL